MILVTNRVYLIAVGYRCIAVGAIPIGISISIPSMLHRISRHDTSINTRGRIRKLIEKKKERKWNSQQ